VVLLPGRKQRDLGAPSRVSISGQRVVVTINLVADINLEADIELPPI